MAAVALGNIGRCRLLLDFTKREREFKKKTSNDGIGFGTVSVAGLFRHRPGGLRPAGRFLFALRAQLRGGGGGGGATSGGGGGRGRRRQRRQAADVLLLQSVAVAPQNVQGGRLGVVDAQRPGGALRHRLVTDAAARWDPPPPPPTPPTPPTPSWH